MANQAIIIVSLSVDPEKEIEFNDFYHHYYIPKLIQIIPEINSVRRYQEHNVDGSIRYCNKRYLTIYECDSEENALRAMEAIKNRPGREQEQNEWKKWQTNSLRNVQHAAVYAERYAHPRSTWDGAFGSRPFFMVSVELSPDKVGAFDDWYENICLPKNLADVPTWAACRRYSTRDQMPARHLTIYEAWDLAGLQSSLELMRAPYRLRENAFWKEWDSGGDSAIIWEEAVSFKPIFRYPA